LAGKVTKQQISNSISVFSHLNSFFSFWNLSPTDDASSRLSSCVISVFVISSFCDKVVDKSGDKTDANEATDDDANDGTGGQTGWARVRNGEVYRRVRMSLVVRNFFVIFDIACDRGLLPRIDAEVVIGRFSEKTKSEFLAESSRIWDFFSSVDFFLELFLKWSIGEGSKIWLVGDDALRNFLAVVISSASCHQIVFSFRHLSIAVHVLQVLSKSVWIKANVIILTSLKKRLAEVLASWNLRPIGHLCVERVDVWRTLACAEIALHICRACRAHSAVLDLVAGGITAGKVEDGVFC